ncbi:MULTISPECIES: hypothetical protein [unclassified Aureispira]|uniref:hypothetical protein n=1 Tax=unclassified Aureispira TaxID=2649989 RepID=UPI0006984C34|nr:MULTISPECIES: hypothetical protein [unclassified Aureispira]WMX15724.1 hypothetical protein QP953_04925 [Aureispira sp. CCB-E]
MSRFIQENKLVIFPPAQYEADHFINPHLGWRWLYIFLAWLLISILLGYYGELLVPVVPDQGFYREFFMSAGQLIFQTVVIGHLTKNRLIHYLGNMMTVSLIGALLLMPVLLLAWWTGWDAPWWYTTYFLVIVGVIILIHKDRVERLKLHWSITLSWIAYRVLLLIIIYGIGPL